MSFSQKVYISTAIKQFSSTELDRLVSTSSTNNEKEDITGILLFTGTSFLQLLEGCCHKLEETYQKIIKDPRHTSFSIICQRQIKNRAYPDIHFSLRTTDETTFQSIYTLFLDDPDSAIKKMNLMTEVKLSKSIGFDPERLLFYANQEPSDSTTANSFFEFSTQVAADEVFLMKDDSEIIYVNDSACRKLEYFENELIGKKVWEWDPLFPKEVWPGFWQDFIQKRHLHFQTQHKKKSGEVFPVEIHAHLYEEKGKQFLLAFVNDISQKMQAHKELTEHKKNLEHIIQIRTEKLSKTYEELKLHKEMLDKHTGVLILDNQLNITYENECFITTVSALGESNVKIHRQIKAQLRKHIDKPHQTKQSTLWKGQIDLSNNQGKKISFEVSPYQFIKDKIHGYYLIATDITEKLEHQKALEFYANHDALSGLKNRNEIHQTFNRLESDLKRCKGNVRFALILVDIDDFKGINDTKGHHIGDEVIRHFSNMLKKSCRSRDEIFRLGGDEFAILTDLFQETQSPSETSERILEALQDAITIEEESLSISCSIGIATYPDSATTLEDLHMNADNALYQSKSQGKGCYNFYTQALNEKSQRYRFIKNHIMSAIKNNEFHIVYQPIVDTDSNTIIAHEALARWDSLRGIIPPEEFFDAAESSNQIDRLSKHLLNKTISDYVKFFTNKKISINCSAKQLIDEENFSGYLIDLIDENNLEPNNFILEITETVLIYDLKNTRTILDKLISKGFTIAIDDFGTGYSSLSLLANLSYHYIKVDKSFIKQAPTEPEKKVLASIINVGQSLGKKIIIEGIETKEQNILLHSMGVSLMQGYYFAKPSLPNKQ